MLLTTLAILSAPAEAGLGIFAPADTDEDGIPDRRDHCVVLPETPNGYADDDGCPDHLAALDVVPWIGRSAVPATITLTRGDRITASTGAVRIADDLVPGEVLTVEARALCYAGRGELVVEQGRNHLDLRLTPRYDQPLQLELTDADGAPLSDVTVRFDSLCAPTGAVTLTDGRGTIRVGEGEHRMLVEAEGFEPAWQTVRAGADPLTVALTPLPVEEPGDAVAEAVDEPVAAPVDDEVPEPVQEPVDDAPAS